MSFFDNALSLPPKDQKMKAIYLTATLCAIPVFFCRSGVVSADCTYANGSRDDTFSTSIPRSLVIPRDTPIGSILFESTLFTHSSSNAGISCYGASTWGVTNNLGITPVGSKFHVIDNSGLSFQVLYNGNPLKDASQSPLQAGIYTLTTPHSN